jgi:hypothetical protein
MSSLGNSFAWCIPGLVPRPEQYKYSKSYRWSLARAHLFCGSRFGHAREPKVRGAKLLKSPATNATRVKLLHLPAPSNVKHVLLPERALVLQSC